MRHFFENYFLNAVLRICTKKQPGDTPAESAFNLYAVWGRVRITLR